MKRSSLIALFGSGLLVLPGDARNLSLPDKVAGPDTDVGFPLTLDSAAGCASIQVQVNFDPAILEFRGFDRGEGLGSQFEPTTYVDNGVAVVIWSRSTNLASGSGNLGRLKFRVNAGARSGLSTPVAIADYEMSDVSGTVKLTLKDGAAARSGSLVVGSGLADSDSDGMPDSWEVQHGLNPQLANGDTDTDRDGRSDLLEYALGGNPRTSDPGRTPFTQVVQEGASSFLALTFDRRPASGLVYRVKESSQLGSWAEVDIATRLTGSPVDHGDGTERVTVRSSFRMTGTGTAPEGFMKLEVIKP